MRRKKLGVISLSVLILLLSFMGVHALEPSLSFYPSSGVISNIEEGFTIDILIDSGGYEVDKVRAVVKFDPAVLQLRRALRDNSLFELWPDDQQSTDNTEGIVMLTGVIQTEGTPLYVTQDLPEVLARLEFDVITQEKQDVVFEFEHSGLDEELKSVIIDGTSSLNILTTKPSSATFYLDIEDIPETGIDMNSLGIIVGIVLILVGAFVRSSRIEILPTRRGTVVLSE